MKIYDDCVDLALQDEVLARLRDTTFSWHRGYDGLFSAGNPDVYDIRPKNHIVPSVQLSHMLATDTVPSNVDWPKGKNWSCPIEWPLIRNLIGSFVNGTKADNLGFKQIKIIRSKANLLLCQGRYTGLVYNQPHIDDSRPHKVLLYYCHNSDGNTFIFDKKDHTHKKILHRVKPKKGRFIIFDGDTFHASSPPQKSPYRMVINTNFLPVAG